MQVFLENLYVGAFPWRVGSLSPLGVRITIDNSKLVTVAEWLVHPSLATYLLWNTHVGKATGHCAGHIRWQRCHTRSESQGMYITTPPVRIRLPTLALKPRIDVTRSISGHMSTKIFYKYNCKPGFEP